MLDAPHSLLRQSYAPQDMRGGGTVNADGFGVGWYPAEAARARPHATAAACPIWADASLGRWRRRDRTPARVLAAVRNATVGMPVVEARGAPFADGRWLFSHNGRVRGWPDSTRRARRPSCPASDLLTLDAPTDSALLWALVRHRLRAGARARRRSPRPSSPTVAAAAPESRLNLLLTDGRPSWRTTWTHSLWVRRGQAAVVVSSEPWDPDDDTWVRGPRPLPWSWPPARALPPVARSTTRGRP